MKAKLAADEAETKRQQQQAADDAEAARIAAEQAEKARLAREKADADAKVILTLSVCYMYVYVILLQAQADIHMPHGPQYAAPPAAEPFKVHLRPIHNLDPVTGAVLYTHIQEETDEIRQHRIDAKLLPQVRLHSVPDLKEACKTEIEVTTAERLTHR